VSAHDITPERMDALLAYLPTLQRFENHPVEKWDLGRELPDGSITMPFPVYPPEVLRFCELAGQSCWMDHGYRPDRAGAMLGDADAVAAASLDQVRTMLTYCVRGERFCDGHWAALIQNGKLTRLLQRLQQLRAQLR